MFFTGADPLHRALLLLIVAVAFIIPSTDSCYLFPSDKPDPCALLKCPPGAKCVIQSSPTPDDADAKTAVRQVLEAIGYFPVDLGSLVAGGQLSQLPFGSLSATNFIKI